MSYEIYRKIKQLKDGSFDIESAPNNCSTATGGKCWNKWNMKYFNEEFPNATNEEKKMIWILYSPYSGDKFNIKNWKRLQERGKYFMKEKGYDTETFYKDKEKFLEYAKEFIKWNNENPDKIYTVSMLFHGSRKMIRKKTKSSVFPVYDVSMFGSQDTNIAQHFSGLSEGEVLSHFRGYEDYQPQAHLTELK